MNRQGGGVTYDDSLEQARQALEQELAAASAQQHDRIKSDPLPRGERIVQLFMGPVTIQRLIQRLR